MYLPTYLPLGRYTGRVLDEPRGFLPAPEVDQITGEGVKKEKKKKNKEAGKKKERKRIKRYV